MSMNELIDEVNAGNFLYKFAKKGSVFSGLVKQSFTPQELDSPAFGFIKRKNSKRFVKA